MKKIRTLMLVCLLATSMFLFAACNGTADCDLDHLDDHTCPVSQTDFDALQGEYDALQDGFDALQEDYDALAALFTVTEINVVDAAEGWEGEDGEYIVDEIEDGDVIQARVHLANGEVAANSDTHITYKWVVGDDTVAGTQNVFTVTSDILDRPLSLVVTTPLGSTTVVVYTPAA